MNDNADADEPPLSPLVEKRRFGREIWLGVVVVAVLLLVVTYVAYTSRG